MTVDRFRLPITAPPPPMTSALRWPTPWLLGLGAVIVLSAVIGTVMLHRRPVAPKFLFQGAVCLWILCMCTPALVVAAYRSRQMQYAPGRVSYLRQAGSVTIRTPLRAGTVIAAYFSLVCIGMGACAVITLWWALNEREFWEANGKGMVTMCIWLPIGIGLLMGTINLATTRGITLTPTHIRAQAGWQRLRDVPWEALGLVSVEEYEAEKLVPAYTSLAMTSDYQNVFIVSSASLGSDPDSVRCVIEFFRQHPEHRQTLGDPRAALELVRGAMMAGWRPEAIAR